MIGDPYTTTTRFGSVSAANRDTRNSNSGWYKLFHPDLRNAGAKRGSILTGIFAWNPVQEAFEAGVSKDKQKLRPGVGSLASPSADHDAHIADYEKDKDKYASAEIDLAKVLLNDNMQSWMCTEYAQCYLC